MSQEFYYLFKEFQRKDGTINRVERPVLKENWDRISTIGKNESGWKPIIYNSPQPNRTDFPELDQARQQIEQKKVEMQMTRKEMVQLLKFKEIDFDAEMENHELLALLRKPVAPKPYVPEGIVEVEPTATQEIQLPYERPVLTNSVLSMPANTTAASGEVVNYTDVAVSDKARDRAEHYKAIEYREMDRFELMRLLKSKGITSYSNRSTRDDLLAMLP